MAEIRLIGTSVLRKALAAFRIRLEAAIQDALRGKPQAVRISRHSASVEAKRLRPANDASTRRVDLAGSVSPSLGRRKANVVRGIPILATEGKDLQCKVTDGKGVRVTVTRRAIRRPSKTTAQ